MAQKRLVLNAAWCKGCGICAAFCPKQVLALKGEKITIEKAEECIFCGQCEQRCPDYAIYIEEELEEVNQWVKPY